MKPKPVTKEDLVGATLAMITLKDNLRQGLYGPTKVAAAIEAVDHAIDILGRAAQAAALAGQPVATDSTYYPEEFIDLFGDINMPVLEEITQKDVAVAVTKLTKLCELNIDTPENVDEVVSVFFHGVGIMWPTLPKGD